MIARNEVTGDSIRTKGPSDAYSSGWDLIFGKKTDRSSVEEQGAPISEVTGSNPVGSTNQNEEA